MKKILDLKPDPKSCVPPISTLLKGSEDDANSNFFRIANFLHSTPYVNSNYALVSLRDIIALSPLNLDVEHNDTDLSPVNAYKWLYLINGLASRTISPDPELENAKLQYVYSIYIKYIKNATLSMPYQITFVSGVLCAISRLIEATKIYPDLKEIQGLYESLCKMLQTKITKIISIISLTEFQEPDIFTYLVPLPQDQFDSGNLFQNIQEIMSSTLLKFVSLILHVALPENLDEFRLVIQPLCISGISVDLARNVLLSLFNGDEEASFQYSDNIQYTKCGKVIAEIAERTLMFKLSLQYEDAISLHDNLSHVKEIAQAHPKYWQSYILSYPDFIQILFSLLNSDYETDFLCLTIVLIRLSEIQLPDPSIPLNFLIASRSKQLRTEAIKLLLQIDSLIPHLLTSFSTVCNCGSRSDLFFDFLAQLLPIVPDPLAIISALIDSLKNATYELQSLPNAHIYCQLAEYIDVPSSYLDPQPCTICNNPERSFSNMHLNDLQTAAKYTHNQIFNKLVTPIIVQKFSLSLTMKKKNRSPKLIKIYVSNAELKSDNDLLTDAPNWRHVADLNFAQDATEATAVLPLHLFVTCIQFHFADFWEDLNQNVTLNCPFCHRPIQDRRSGYCQKCHENAYQCRDCRAINYNYLDGYICYQCGYSNYASFDWTIRAYNSFSHTHITNDDDCNASLVKCDDLLEQAHSNFALLTNLRKQIDEVLSPASGKSVNKKTTQLNTLYNEKCKSQFIQLSEIVQHICAIRNAVGRFKNKVQSYQNIKPNMCYNCRTTYIQNILKFFISIMKCEKLHAIADELDIPSLLFSFVKQNSIFTPTATNTIVTFCTIRPELTYRVVNIFVDELPDVSTQLVKLLCQLEALEDDSRAYRHTLITGAIVASLKYMSINSSFASIVINPLVSSVCQSPLVIRTNEKYLMHEAYNAWRKYMKKSPSKLIDPLHVFVDNDTIKSLFIDCPSSSIRSSLGQLLKIGSALTMNHAKRVFDFAYSIAFKVEKYENKYRQCFNALLYLMEYESYNMHCMMNGFLEKVIKLLEIEIDYLFQRENQINIYLDSGKSIEILFGIILKIFTPASHIRYAIYQKLEVLKDVIRLFFKLTSIKIQKSKAITNTICSIKELIRRLLTDYFIIDGVVYDDITIFHKSFFEIAFRNVNERSNSLLVLLDDIINGPPLIFYKLNDESKMISSSTKIRSLRNKNGMDNKITCLLSEPELSLSFKQLFQRFWIHYIHSECLVLKSEKINFNNEQETEKIKKTTPVYYDCDCSPLLTFLANEKYQDNTISILKHFKNIPDYKPIIDILYKNSNASSLIAANSELFNQIDIDQIIQNVKVKENYKYAKLLAQIVKSKPEIIPKVYEAFSNVETGYQLANFLTHLPLEYSEIRDHFLAQYKSQYYELFLKNCPLENIKNWKLDGIDIMPGIDILSGLVLGHEPTQDLLTLNNNRIMKILIELEIRTDSCYDAAAEALDHATKYNEVITKLRGEKLMQSQQTSKQNKD